MITRDKIAGSLYGLALGDAVARPTEFMRLSEIYKTYGREGYMPLPLPALFTDDTQLTLAVARALDMARHVAPRELVRTFSNEFMRWRVQDPPRAPGVSCMTSIGRLAMARRRHESWTTAPVLSKGCGANMRVAPTALLPSMDHAINLSQLQAALTHAHPVAIVATELTALAIRWAAEGADLVELPRMLLGRAYTQRNTYREEWLGRLQARWAPGDLRRAWDRMINVLLDVVGALENRPWDVCRALGASWTADEALATALYHAITYRDDPVLAISMAARTSGDSDSIACITGAIVGAHAGQSAWPTPWCNRIERRRDIESAVTTILDAKM